MGKGTLGKVGLILLTRKPAPTCAHGLRLKTQTQPMAWPAQQRIHREGEGKGEGLGLLSGEFVWLCPGVQAGL